MDIKTFYHQLLTPYIAFRSISTDITYQHECIACANWLQQIFVDYGLSCQLITGYDNPLVYAHYHHDDTLPTLLIYGHYDVQPAEQADGRVSDPFVLTERNGRYYARGAVDNKGQTMIHIVTVLDAIRHNKTLHYNIKFLIEGDEETGSPHIQQAIKDHQTLLSCDYVLVSDGEMISNDTPTMVASFRGGANLTLNITTATTDLHSGLYGNIAPNASHEASKLIAQLYDDQGMISIPGRYDDLDLITPTQLENNTKVPFDPVHIQKISGIRTIIQTGPYDPVTANGLLPTIQVSGIQSGYSSNGYKNIIPGSAIIKINFRFGPGQDPLHKLKQFEIFVKDTLPDYVYYSIETSDPYPAIILDITNPFTQKIAQLTHNVFQKSVIMRYCGAAVPITGLFQDILQAKVAVLDLGNEDCNMHGVDENIDIACIDKGLATSQAILCNEYNQ